MELEEQAKAALPAVPKTFAAALRLAAETQERLEAAEAHVALNPTLRFDTHRPAFWLGPFKEIFMTTALTIASTAIRRDSAGRYCLNDLHKAAGGAPKDQPSRWYSTDSGKALIQELWEQTPGWTGRGPTENQGGPEAPRCGCGGG